MKDKLYSDVLEFVDAVKAYPCTVVYKDNIEEDPPTLGFLASDGIRLAITLEDFQKSIKDYAPNNRKIALFTTALKSEEGKKNFCKFVNEGKEDKKENQYEEVIKNIPKPDGNIIDDNFKGKIFSLLDDCAKDLLSTVSTMSDKALEEWKKSNAYSKLLVDVLNGVGPKELWLKVVLDHLEEHGGTIGG